MKPTVESLIRKYDVAVPRYTSYPTVPFWDTENFSLSDWKKKVSESFCSSNQAKGISLYIHLPFCESLCTYCACNTRITKNHSVEKAYIDAVLKEWDLYKKNFNTKPVIREIHLGGGTPTFFNPRNLQYLITKLLEGTFIHLDSEFSFEGHPNNTTLEHLQVLYNLGFNRVSYGVQDLDPKVQKAIHRIQPFNQLSNVTEQSREVGYQSISFDLIYGLPYQTLRSIYNTIKEIITLKPDRIAFYSYAHVPWMKPGQRGYEDADLPSDVEKRSLYETGRELFKEAGYIDIGMDHFALPSDSLAVAHREGRLHRNFMGYTTSQTDLLIGLGVSAISDASNAYAQNIKRVEDYQEAVNNGEFAIFKGHLHSREDLLIKKCIHDIACSGFLDAELLSSAINYSIMQDLRTMQKEGIVTLTQKGLTVTSIGRIFIRNICSLFDQRLHMSQQGDSKLFSKAI